MNLQTDKLVSTISDWVKENVHSHRIMFLVDKGKDHEKIIELAKKELADIVVNNMFIEKFPRDDIEEGTIQIIVAFEWVKN